MTFRNEFYWWKASREWPTQRKGEGKETYPFLLIFLEEDKMATTK